MDLESVACNFCGQKEGVPFLMQDGFNLVRCPNCGLLYVNPRPCRSKIGHYYAAHYYAHSPRRGVSQFIHQSRQRLLLAIAYNRLGYDVSSPSDSSEYRSHLWRILAALLEKRFNRTPPYPGPDTLLRSLDLGCGSGEYVSLLQKLGWEAWGIEPDPMAVQIAQQKRCMHVSQGTLEDTHFASASYDLITFWDSLEHTFDPQYVLLEAHRILKSGGWLYIKVPDPLCLEAKLWRQDWVGYDLPRHLYHFPVPVLIDLLKRLDFEIQEVRYVSPPNIIASGLILGLTRRWSNLTFLHRLSMLLTFAFVPLAFILDRFGTGNTYQIIARK